MSETTYKNAGDDSGHDESGHDDSGHGTGPDATADAAAQLAELRQSIDNIDTALIAILAERFRCTQAVGQLKARSKMPAADPAREARQIARLRALASSSRLDPDFAEKFLNFIIREVIRHHEAIARDGTLGGTPGGSADGTNTGAAGNRVDSAP